MLEQAGLQHGGEMDDSEPARAAKGKEKAGDEPTDNADAATAAIEMLKVCIIAFLAISALGLTSLRQVEDDTDELRMYGEHSIFSHLPGPGGTSPEPLSTSYNAGLNFFAAASPSFIADQSLASDWSRNLPPGLDFELHELLLDLFLTHIEPWNSWTSGSVDESLFRRDLSRCCEGSGPERTSYYSPMRECSHRLREAQADVSTPSVHNAVLALATVLSPDPRLADGSLSNALAAKAKTYIEMEVERPMLSTLQGELARLTFSSPKLTSFVDRSHGARLGAFRSRSTRCRLLLCR